MGKGMEKGGNKLKYFLVSCVKAFLRLAPLTGLWLRWMLFRSASTIWAKDSTVPGDRLEFESFSNRGFQKWGYPNSWMVYNGKSLPPF